jgi:transcriptional regulator with XRE-family HTH domain
MDRKEKVKQSDKPIIGKNIMRLRIQNHLRNVDVVAKLQLAGVEISTSTLSKIERGYSNPTVRMLIALTEIFHCDFNAFFYEDDRK